MIDAIGADAAEFGFKLAAVGGGVHIAGGVFEFIGEDNATLGGGELKRGPICASGGGFEEIEKMIAAFGSAHEESAAAAIGKGGAEYFAPGFGFDGGELIEDEEIEAGTEESFGVEGAFDGNRGTVDEPDGLGGFAGFGGVEFEGSFLEARPGDAGGLSAEGADVPTNLIGAGGGGADDFGEGELGFAKAAAGDEDAETGGRGIDFELLGV